MRGNTAPSDTGDRQFRIPSITLPTGGGAIRGIGEKFAANPVTGTGSMSVPIATSPGRSGFGPQLSLSYDSGSGNGPFGFGWSLSLPSITRKTDKGLPQYRDAEESDVFILSGAEDLVPVLPSRTALRFKDDTHRRRAYLIHRYRPRIEGLFARIERWTKVATGEIHWRSITRDNVTTLYGEGQQLPHLRSRRPVSGQSDAHLQLAHLRELRRQGQRHRLRVRGRERRQRGSRPGQRAQPRAHRQSLPEAHQVRQPRLAPHRSRDLSAQASWMFEVVFDYDEGHYEEVDLDPARPEAEQHRFVRASASAASALGGSPRPVLLPSRRLRGAHVSPLPPRPDVPSHSRPSHGREGLRRPGAVHRVRLRRP